MLTHGQRYSRTSSRGSQVRSYERGVMWIAFALAGVAAFSYLLIGWQFLPVGDLNNAEAPAAITYVCAGCYLVGGLLIMLHKRWLWVTGLLINTLVVFLFFTAYISRPVVILSPGGLVSKIAELLLEISLLYLVFVEARPDRR